ncbi:MAG: hypothetical protein KDG50_05940 [Chromatiales bacterium]|nr:hypothetical protein [Chromatiales bacterium]
MSATTPSEQERQILATHAAFIRGVVEACGDPSRRAPIEQLFPAMVANGWQALVEAVRAIFAGKREAVLAGPLDDEDRAVVRAILRGLQNPDSLPTPEAPDPAAAAPGLAGLIRAAARGDAQALAALGTMGEQMRAAGGDLARLAGVIRPMLNGERDLDRLTRGMGERGQQLLRSIVEALERSLH